MSRRGRYSGEYDTLDEYYDYGERGRHGIAGGRWRSGAHRARRDPTHKHRWEETYEDRLDDLGESPDY